MNELQLWQKRVSAQTEIILQQKLPQISQEPAVLHEAMRYSALDGGKRLRPLPNNIYCLTVVSGTELKNFQWKFFAKQAS